MECEYKTRYCLTKVCIFTYIPKFHLNLLIFGTSFRYPTKWSMQVKESIQCHKLLVFICIHFQPKSLPNNQMPQALVTSYGGINSSYPIWIWLNYRCLFWWYVHLHNAPANSCSSRVMVRNLRRAWVLRVCQRAESFPYWNQHFDRRTRSLENEQEFLFITQKQRQAPVTGHRCHTLIYHWLENLANGHKTMINSSTKNHNLKFLI